MGGGRPTLELTNGRDGADLPDPGLWIRGERALGSVTVELSVRFADQEVTWSIGPLWTEATELWIPLLVPPAAVIDEAQRTWITPLSGEVFTDVGARLVDGGLAWPDGLDQPAEAEENRTTRYDVVRMLWDLRTDQGLSPAQLSNLAVNTCFRTWQPADGTSSNDAHCRGGASRPPRARLA